VYVFHTYLRAERFNDVEETRQVGRDREAMVDYIYVRSADNDAMAG
jgi:hypothetical protein